MSVVPSVEKDEITISMFLDWDKYKNCFYNNLYLEDYKVVIKIPLIKDKPRKDDLKIKKFNLAKYTYLVSYE
ncbi:MAG: hypothetical protein KGD73_03830 [Candidatus Lokiarchaeota archaeon]|nr:hypothetical protein [Candidatus Lokiarchaeota archaeon]